MPFSKLLLLLNAIVPTHKMQWIILIVISKVCGHFKSTVFIN